MAAPAIFSSLVIPGASAAVTDNTPVAASTAAAGSDTGGATEITAPRPPEISFISSAALCPGAEVTLRSTDKEINRRLATERDFQPVIESPTTFYVEKKLPGLGAKYAYAITRGTQVLVSADKPLSIEYTQIKIQHRTDALPGLRSGPVQLWIWGIDSQGRVSPPSMRTLIIAGRD